MAKIKIHHIQMTVANIERSVDFYVNKIGLKLNFLSPIDLGLNQIEAQQQDNQNSYIQPAVRKKFPNLL